MNDSIPEFWIGMRKGGLDTCTTLGEALVPLQISKLVRSLLMLGATGFGKSTALLGLLAQDILAGHGVIVLDGRGDIVRAALRMCREHVPPEKVFVFSFREQDNPIGFSPLIGHGPEYFRVFSLVQALKHLASTWGPQLEETLRYCLLLLARANEPITNLELLLTSAEYRQMLSEFIDAESEQGFWNRFEKLSPEQQATLTSPVLNKLSGIFATKGLRRMLGHQEPVDLGKVINEPGSVILIDLALDELHGVAHFMGALFLSAILREVFARTKINPEERRVPTRLYVDEFHLYPVDDYESVLVECRKFRMPCVLSTQSIVQLTPRMRSIILGNVGAKLFFRTGREDSAILSKDLTGDSRAIDFTSLPTGEAYLWTNDQEPLHIECNEPIRFDTSDEKEFQTYLEEIKRKHPPYQERDRTFRISPIRKAQKIGLLAESSRLEDWL